MSAEEYKQKGNEALQKKDMQGALDNYSKGLEIEPTNHLLLTNRAAVYLQLQKYKEAFEDSAKAATAKPDFGRAYLRQGQALFAMGKLQEAKDVLEKAAQIEPSNAQITKQLQDVQQKMQEQSTQNPLAGLFNSADFWTKITTNPELSGYLTQPDFLQKVQDIQKNPNKINEHLKDQRIMKLLMSLMGMKGDVAGGDDMDEDTPQQSASHGHDHDDHSNCSHDHHAPPQQQQQTKQEEKKPEPKKEETKSGSANQQALAEKEKGNALFKQKKFDEALVHYNKAAEIDPSDITYRLNKAAVYIEQSKFEEAVKECQDAVEYGRANRADFKTIGRALERMGNAYMRQKDYRNAIKCYTESLTEEQSREVAKKKQQAEQLLAKQIEDEYKSPEKAEEARLRGNELFKQNNYPAAMKEYNEAIKRDPTKANYYFNRCVCYLKLGEPNYALKDADKALEIDPNYPKAMARKAQCHIMRKEYHKAVDTYKHGLQLEAENAELKEGLVRVTQLIQSKSNQRDEDRVRMAMNDPDVMMIMNDPIMKQVLSDFSENPREAQKHLKNAQVLEKIEKLIAAGVIQTG